MKSKRLFSKARSLLNCLKCFRKKPILFKNALKVTLNSKYKELKGLRISSILKLVSIQSQRFLETTQTIF